MTKNWIGLRFGRLVVTDVLPDRKALCDCDCGNTTVVFRCNLSRPNTRSCGCIKHEMYANGGPTKRHGASGTPEFRSWAMMKNRCLNPNAEVWSYYGGRGIKV